MIWWNGHAAAPLDGPDLTIVVMADEATFASVVEATQTMLDSLEVVTP